MSDIFMAAEDRMQAIVDRQQKVGRAEDEEVDHIDADVLLVTLLRETSYGEANAFLDLYDQVMKWYA